MKKTEIRASASPWRNGIEVWVVQGGAYGVSITMETKEEGLLVDPTLRISMTEAQVLMDDLWSAGLRPTEGTGSAGSLRATEKHLADMRAIAFKRLGMNERADKA